MGSISLLLHRKAICPNYRLQQTLMAFVEHATLDLAKVISLKLGKITQKQISDFKKEKLSSNTVKDILASSNDDVCKVRFLNLSYYSGV
jgi:hypothetical protein